MKLVHLIGFIIKKRDLFFLKSKVCVSVANIITAIVGQNKDRILSLSRALILRRSYKFFSNLHTFFCVCFSLCQCTLKYFLPSLYSLYFSLSFLFLSYFLIVSAFCVPCDIGTLCKHSRSPQSSVRTPDRCL